MTRSEQNKLSAKAEVILMGIHQSVEDMDEAVFMIAYILRVGGKTQSIRENAQEEAEKVIDRALQYCQGNAEIAYIGTSRVLNMPCINLVIDTKDEELDVTSENGALTWVENLDYPDCSELGYCFFEKKLKGLCRIA